MDFNLITNAEQCHQLIKETVSLSLVYYSHIPTAIISLLVGLFVILKNRDLISKVLLGISITFSLWLFLDLIVWIGNYNTVLTMFVWSLLGMLDILFFMLSLYFVYLFIDKRDMPFNKKVILGVLFLPIIIFTSTRFNLSGFTFESCEAIDGKSFLDYIFYLEIAIAAWIILLSVGRYLKVEKDSKRQILLLVLGIIIFLLSFFGAGYIAGQTGNYDYELYGHFGMTVFMGFLAYLIVKFKAFDIKLLGEQALIVSQFALIAAMFTFATSTTNRILISITLAGTAIMGWFLIKSSKKLDERKEQLQIMAGKLSQANDQLRTLDNAKTEFISIASHQLRTPLTAIKGFISMLLEGSYGKLIPQQEDVLNKVYSSNERLVNLVEDLLNVSRMESGRMEFKFASWDMDKICQEVIDTFALRAKSCKLDLEYIKPEVALPELLIDGVKVREVISNLTDNAIKYTLEGHGGVKVKLEQLGENIRVTVSDTGIGIPDTELPYLFAKFSRGKDISRLNTGGTGLGLYVGKSMIENNGGRIWAESDGQNLGSRFIIELPIKQSEELLKKWG